MHLAHFTVVLYIYLFCYQNGTSWPSDQCTGLAFLTSRVCMVWVGVPVLTLVSLIKTLNHYCFILPMRRKSLGPMCCVMHIQEPSTLILKRRSLPGCFLVWMAADCATTLCLPCRQSNLHFERPSGVIKRYIRTACIVITYFFLEHHTFSSELHQLVGPQLHYWLHAINVCFKFPFLQDCRLNLWVRVFLKGLF